MFEELAGYIKGIVFFSLFANLILDFMPNINYKKYIKVLIGILLIIVILKPILNFDFLLNATLHSALWTNIVFCPIKYV